MAAETAGGIRDITAGAAARFLPPYFLKKVLAFKECLCYNIPRCGMIAVMCEVAGAEAASGFYTERMSSY